MKKVLYITNIEIPYRVQFFNELAEYCELTVLYERRKSINRDEKWTSSVRGNYRTEYLNGIHFSNENSLSFKIFKYVSGGYDVIIVGCVNSPIQILAMTWMKLMRIPYCLNLDGVIHLEGTSLKTQLKKLIMKGAYKYLVAGEAVVSSVRKIAKDSDIIPYYFSSLTENELETRRSTVGTSDRNNTVLVIGQYFDYKGLDIALQAARLDPSISYKFVGMGVRTELFRQELSVDEVHNVELIPFLQKDDLCIEYQRCGMLLLPSRKECWGLVINEAASFGMPIAATWGSGAAVEFMANAYPDFLAEPGNAEELLKVVRAVRELSASAVNSYSAYLADKGRAYSIERSVKVHVSALLNNEQECCYG